MKSFFDKSFYLANRRALQNANPEVDVFVLAASGLLQKSNDTTYIFRQDSNFMYLTGIAEPDLVLVINKDREYLISPKRSSSQEVFDGKIDNAKLSQISGVEQVLSSEAGWKELEGLLNQSSKVGILQPADSYVERMGFYTNPARSALLERLKGHKISSSKLVDVRSSLTRLRSVKQPAEIRALQAAIDLTIDSFLEVYTHRQNYKFEYQIEADMTARFISSGRRHAYEPIVASGQNACTLHYVSNRAQIKTNDLVLIDVGAEAEYYAADITRSFAINRPTARQSEVLDAVVKVQKYAYSLLKPGVVLRDYEKQVEDYMGESLKKLGLIKTINKNNVRKYFPHSVSHFLGLDVHDVADYNQPLQPNMVLTVEPGIYIPQENLGVRIEDDVLITERGIKVLSERLPSRLG